MSNNNLSVLLIQPPLPANERHKKVLPLSLAYLAAYVRDKLPNVELEILDAQVLNLSYADVMQQIISKKRDIIGITYWTAQALFAYRLSKAIKSWDPEVLLVHGGVHTTSCPEEAATYADYCVLQEGEQTFAELVTLAQDDRKAIGQIEGIAYQDNGNFKRTASREYIRDLDSIPFPAWDLLPMEQYDTQLHIVGGKRVPVVGSRGCPYNCTYCVSPLMWQRKVRWRNPECVVAEIEEIIKRYHIPQFHFWDDNLMMNAEYVTGLCEAILQKGLKIKWTGLTRASHITKQHNLLPLMAKSGCIGMEIGIESANPITFIEIHKDESLANLELAGKYQQEAGMHPMFTYMAFNPGETITGYYLQAQFIDKLLAGEKWYEHFHPLPFPVYIGQFCTAYPGTELYREVPKLGMRLVDDWSDFYHHKVNFLPNSLLDDVPVRTLGNLDISHYYFCMKAAQSGYYDFVPKSDPFWFQVNKRTRFMRYVTLFFQRSSGKMTIRQIAIDLAAYLRIEEKESYRFSAICALVLGQIGLIRSAIYQQELNIKPRCIPYQDTLKTRLKYTSLHWLSELRAVLLE
jgi:radical SAM superfamily enzyme YgiQ (UPF0313 family)